MVSAEEAGTRHKPANVSNSQAAAIIASITGVAGAGFRLSLILNAVSCEVASEGLEVHSISKGVTLFALTLKQTGTALQAADSVHTWDALDGVRTIAEDATRIFDEFNDMLDRVRQRPTDGTAVPSIQQRFQWCFKRHRVTYLLAQLDTHKMSLSVILQVLQLGKLMASTSRRDAQEEVLMKQELIKQERAETQNVLIVRYWQMGKLDRLYDASRREDDDDKIAAEEHQDDDLTLVASTESSQLTIEAPPAQYTTSMALIKLPNYSLGELDQTLHKIKQSPKDMVQVSSEAIDPLLDRWTRWYEIREQRHKRESQREPSYSSRFAPKVDSLYEGEDEERQYYEQYRERDDSPQGYYLEGNTTDWRKPHSRAAQQEAKKRRQKYSKYQASVSAQSSDVEDSPNSNASKKKKRSPKHHIIDSASESDSDPEQPQVRVRRGSASPTTERARMVYPDGAPLSHSYTTGTGQNMPRKATNPTSPAVGSRLNPAPQMPQRPYAAPDQQMHHAYSSPMPPIHTANAPNPYQYPNQQYPTYAAQYPPPNQPPLSAAQARYMPQPTPLHRMPMPPRPVSQDGKGRSPSRTSYPPAAGFGIGGERFVAPPGSYTTSQAYGPSSGLSSREQSGSGSSKKTKEEKKQDAKRNLREGATKGLLGAGAIAGFLEALEGLSI